MDKAAIVTMLIPMTKLPEETQEKLTPVGVALLKAAKKAIR